MLIFLIKYARAGKTKRANVLFWLCINHYSYLKKIMQIVFINNPFLLKNVPRCMYIRGFRIFQALRYHGIEKATVSRVFGDLKSKISELSD